MKKILTLIIFLLGANVTFAQIKMKGIVKDSLGTPLELANVIAINSQKEILIIIISLMPEFAEGLKSTTQGPHNKAHRQPGQPARQSVPLG